MEGKSSTTVDSMPGMSRMTRSTVLSQSDVYTVEEEQTIIKDDNCQETNRQHPVSSKQQVDKPIILSRELDDTAELDIDVNYESIIDELFTEHSSSIIYENDVMLNKATYPETIEGCIQVINELRQAQKALHLPIAENEHLLGCLQSDALNTQQETVRLHRVQKHREIEYSRGYHEVHRGRYQGGGSRTGFPASTKFVSGDRRRSKSSGSATSEVNSRQSDRRPADQR